MIHACGRHRLYIYTSKRSTPPMYISVSLYIYIYIYVCMERESEDIASWPIGSRSWCGSDNCSCKSKHKSSDCPMAALALNAIPMRWAPQIISILMRSTPRFYPCYPHIPPPHWILGLQFSKALQERFGHSIFFLWFGLKLLCCRGVRGCHAATSINLAEEDKCALSTHCERRL